MRELLWAKFWVGTAPLLILALAIVGVTDYLLKVSAFMFVVSTFTIGMMTFAIAGLAIGFGTVFPQFETERWKDTETREIPIGGQTEKVKIATSYRVEGHKEVRIVSIENLVTDKGVVAMYYQTPLTSTADDDIEIMLKSMN